MFFRLILVLRFNFSYFSNIYFLPKKVNNEGSLLPRGFNFKDDNSSLGVGVDEAGTVDAKTFLKISSKFEMLIKFCKKSNL